MGPDKQNKMRAKLNYFDAQKILETVHLNTHNICFC